MSQCESPLNMSVCQESHDEMLAYVPKPPNNPSISQQDHDTRNDDTRMEDAAAEEEKKHAPTQSSNDRKDARAECESSITQPSKSDQQVRTAKRVTWAKQEDTKFQADSTQGVNKKKKKQLGNLEEPKQMFYRPKTSISEPPPAAAEKQKDNTGEITQQRKTQEQVTQLRKENATGSRTHNEENQGKNDATSESRTNGTVNTQQPTGKQKSQQ